MRWDDLYPGFVLVMAGTCTLLFGSLLDYLHTSINYRRERARVEGACEQDDAFRQQVGDIDEYIHNNNLATQPDFCRSLMLRSMQPLFVMAFFAVVVHFVAYKFRILGLVWLLAATGMLILHEFHGRDAWGNRRRYRLVLMVVWIVSFVMVEWLAMQSSGSLAPAAGSMPASP